MDQADFVQWARRSEQASAHNSSAYRVSIAAFAALGYTWVVGCAALALAAVVWVAVQTAQGYFRFQWTLLLVGAVGLLWISGRALWARLKVPDGIEIFPADAPELFAALERIRNKIKGPRLHHVYLDGDFNASIRQELRFGLLGGAVNHLTMGLPLLMALDRPRFLAVLAHEYGHLRGDHGRFSAWIYRTRQSWMRMLQSLESKKRLTAVVSQAFLRWYLPRFCAKSFALARQEEYEADRVAGQLLGREAMAAALAEMEIRGIWLHTEFWGRHWCNAGASAVPTGPFRALRRRLAEPPDVVFANDALRQALRRTSSMDDTHPALRDRMEALDAAPTMPDWSRGSGLALLGTKAKRWIAHFDKQWCKHNATQWKRHHGWLAGVREQVDVFNGRIEHLHTGEMMELARLMQHLDPRASVRHLYEQVLQIQPAHAGALRGMVESLEDGDRETKIQYLHRLWEADGGDRYWVARTAIAELETARMGFEHDAVVFKQWRKRLERAQESEERVWEELSGTSFFSQIVRHDLSPIELSEVQSRLGRCGPVVRCWLVKKNLRESPQRRAYVVFIEVPDRNTEDRSYVCRTLERTLSLPGPALVLCAGQSPTVEAVRRAAFDPIFSR